MLVKGTHRDTLEVHALASGSSGNSFLIKSGTTNILIDAGVGVRTLAPALARRGVGAEGLDAILITHEHTDHVSGLEALIRRTKAPVVANSRTLTEIKRRYETDFVSRELPTGDTIGIGSVGIRSFAVAHDAVETVGYCLETNGCTIIYATDTGHVTDGLREAIRGASLAIVEANHDLSWLLRGPYSEDMKRRVASDTGHLANADCADMIAERLEEGGTLAVWLAHLSRVNNSPALAKRSVLARVATQTSVPFLLEVALRDHPSLTWTPGRQAVQLSLL